VFNLATLNKNIKRMIKKLQLFIVGILLLGSASVVSAQSCFTETSQADFQADVSNNTDLITSPGDVLLNLVSVDQQNTTLGTSGVGITTTTWGGQTFTPAATGTLTQVSINLFCSGCTGTAPSLVVQIKATSGGLPTGAALATGSITGFNNGASAYYTSAVTPVVLTSGTQYAITVHPSANPSPGTYALTRSGTATAGSDVYAGGTRITGATTGTVWSIPLTGGVSTDAGFKTYMTVNNIAGNITSQTKDAGLPANWSTLSYTATTSANQSVEFQIAGSNSPTGPFNFVGPDGTATTYYTSSGSSLSQFSNVEYLQYKAFLNTTDGTTPVLSDVQLCYRTCSTPTVTLSGDTIIPIGGTTTLTASGTPTFTWSTNSTNSSIVVSPTVTTSYTVIGTSASGGCTDTVRFSVHMSGAALNFDGVDDYVDAGNFYLSSYTKEAWVYTTDATKANNVISSNNAPFWLNGGNLSATNNFGGGVVVSDPGTISANAWTHVAVTYDSASSTMTLYKNGIQVAQNSSIQLIGTAEDLQIGTYVNISGTNFVGNMDEVRIWKRALCAAEIQNNMTGEVTKNAPGLIAYYKFNQGVAGENNTTISTATDSSINAFNAPLNNFALTGTTSNFVAPGAVTSGSFVTVFTNSLSAVATQTNVSCYGYSDGVASVAVTGIGSPFTYAWSAGGTSTTTNTYTSLSAGNYTCTIGNGCGTITKTFTITIPTQLVASSTSGTIACNGGMTTVTVSATGGTQNYGGDAGVSTNVTAGSYTYTVIDANQCTATTTLTIGEPTLLQANSVAGTILCNGGATTVTVSATGGTGTLTGEGTFSVTANSYTYTVTDANTCTATTTITISDPPLLQASATAGAISCNGGVTTVTVAATGGTPNLSGTGIFVVTANSYTYTVTDGNSCAATTTITVGEPTLLQASSTSGTIACNGGTTTVTVSATGGTGTLTGTGTFTTTANSYTYTVTDANQCVATTTINIGQPTLLQASATAGAISCNGGVTTVTVSATGGTTNYTGTGTFTTTAGTYTYNVSDANSCAATTTLTIIQPNVLMASSISGTIACNGGATTITVTATGGTTNYSGDGVMTNITAGSYTYTVTDANQCSATTTISVSQPNAVDASVNVSGGTISANNATATYQWVDCNNSNAPISGAMSQSFSPPSAGNYAVVVTEGSCSATSTCTPISTTGIAQNKTAISLQVYPNPFSNQLTIVSSAKTTAMLFDMLGNQIRSFDLEAATQTINVGELAPGMYYLQVAAQKIKIMKQ
jgi:hypothetical protein